MFDETDQSEYQRLKDLFGIDNSTIDGMRRRYRDFMRFASPQTNDSAINSKFDIYLHAYLNSLERAAETWDPHEFCDAFVEIYYMNVCRDLNASSRRMRQTSAAITKLFQNLTDGLDGDNNENQPPSPTGVCRDLNASSRRWLQTSAAIIKLCENLIVELDGDNNED